MQKHWEQVGKMLEGVSLERLICLRITMECMNTGYLKGSAMTHASTMCSFTIMMGKAVSAKLIFRARYIAISLYQTTAEMTHTA